MIVLCINHKWSVKSVVNIRILFKIMISPMLLPIEGREYYVDEIVQVRGDTYYKLNGYPDDVAFHSKHFTFSKTNVSIQDQIEESLMI